MITLDPKTKLLFRQSFSGTNKQLLPPLCSNCRQSRAVGLWEIRCDIGEPDWKMDGKALDLCAGCAEKLHAPPILLIES